MILFRFLYLPQITTLNETYSCLAHNFVVRPASGMARYKDLVFHPFVRSHQDAILLAALGGGISVLWTHFFSSLLSSVFVTNPQAARHRFRGNFCFCFTGKGVGDVALLQRGHRFIYYLITKEKYSGKPTYDTLKSSLIAMKRHMLENDVEKISMPRIGCGLDLLEWSKVEMMLRDIFQDTDIVITIYTL